MKITLPILLTLLLGVFVSSVSYSQVNHEIEDNKSLEDLYSIEGVYSFQYYGVNHQIKLSSKEKIYVEFDQNGVQLGSGRFIRNSRNFILRPDVISTYSILNASTQFEIVSKVGDDLNIVVMVSDESSEEVQLIKL